jgi:hypothetical protein
VKGFFSWVIFDDLDDLFSVPEFKEILAEKVADQIHAITYDSDLVVMITDDDVNRMVNSSFFDDRSESQREDLKVFFTEAADHMNEWLEEAMTEASAEVADGVPINHLFSNETLLTMITAIVVLIGIIVLINWHWIPPFMYTGIAAILAGITVVYLTNFLEKMPFNQEGIEFFMILFNSVVGNLAKTGYIAIGIGIALIISYFSLRYMNNNSSNREINN